MHKHLTLITENNNFFLEYLELSNYEDLTGDSGESSETDSDESVSYDDIQLLAELANLNPAPVSFPLFRSKPINIPKK